MKNEDNAAAARRHRGAGMASRSLWRFLLPTLVIFGASACAPIPTPPPVEPAAGPPPSPPPEVDLTPWLRRDVSFAPQVNLPPRGARDLSVVMASVGGPALGRLEHALWLAGFAEEPPSELRMLAFKQEKRMELWGRRGATWRWIKSYPVRAASGVSGPKLRQGDHQVPEGDYAINFLNPNSLYHLSMRVDYPSAEDRRIAAEEGRGNLGGDIMVHGRASSIGCLAMGDPAIEELFALTYKIGVSRTRILIAPWDFRERPPPPTGRAWLAERYEDLERKLRIFDMGRGLGA